MDNYRECEEIFNFKIRAKEQINMNHIPIFTDQLEKRKGYYMR